MIMIDVFRLESQLRLQLLSTIVSWAWLRFMWTRTTSRQRVWIEQIRRIWWKVSLWPSQRPTFVKCGQTGSSWRTLVNHEFGFFQYSFNSRFCWIYLFSNAKELFNLAAAWNCKSLCHHCHAREDSYLEFPSQLAFKPRRTLDEFVNICKPHDGERCHCTNTTVRYN